MKLCSIMYVKNQESLLMESKIYLTVAQLDTISKLHKKYPGKGMTVADKFLPEMGVITTASVDDNEDYDITDINSF